jgi:hypothetical protein
MSIQTETIGKEYHLSVMGGLASKEEHAEFLDGLRAAFQPEPGRIQDI